MIVERYSDAAEWDAFVRSSRNGTFLHERGYMDYHADRFPDHSLVVRDDGGSIILALAAHANTELLQSHAGLSYGGVIVGRDLKTPAYLAAMEELLLHAGGCVVGDSRLETLYYKPVPHIYHRYPAEEERFVLAKLGAVLTRCDLLSVVDRDDRLPYQHRRARGIKKAEKAGVTVQREEDFAPFWALLEETLAERHAAKPVHSLEEMRLLTSRFRENIRLHTARTGELLAGVILYVTDTVAHCQYIAASKEGREVGALDLLFDVLLSDTSHDCRWFDFGGSHEDGGEAINAGLIDQKEGFGARSVAAEHWWIDLCKVKPGILTGALR